MRKEEEARSSSIFSMYDADDPVVNFDDYIKDNDSIIDKVSLSLVSVKYACFNMWMCLRVYVLALGTADAEIEIPSDEVALWLSLDTRIQGYLFAKDKNMHWNLSW